VPEARGVTLLRRSRVGHLATADARGRPHVVPVCFAFDGRRIVTALDEKPKRVGPRRLRRVRNIRVNPHVAFIVDRYDEDWRRLRFVLVLGVADVLEPGTRAHREAVARLRRKYPQYRGMRLGERPVLRITPRRIVAWSAGRRARPTTVR
jgi:PPOX class probable F420-dependent enzyme